MSKVKSVLESLRIETDVEESTTKVNMPPKIRKSISIEFFRVHPTFEFGVNCLANAHGYSLYFVAPTIADGVTDQLKPIKISFCVNRDGEFFFYPRTAAAKNGFPNRWTESAKVAIEIAKNKWVRVTSNNSSGQYDLTVAKAELEEPVWPELGEIEQMLEQAIIPLYIEDYDHIYLKKLRGER